MASELVEKYIRKETLPNIWCPGCSNGIVTAAIVRAIDNLGLDQDKVCIVSGIGCSSRASGYLDFNTLHTPMEELLLLQQVLNLLILSLQ